MAHAEQTAPLQEEVVMAVPRQPIHTLPLVKSPSNPIGVKEKEALSQVYDPSKNYVFELAAQNPERAIPIFNLRTKRNEPNQKFKNSHNLTLTSQIVWDGGRVNLRYYDGCESVFVSEQPKEKDVIDQLMQQTRPRRFLKGKLSIRGYDRMLLLYLNLCGWNVESPFRTETSYGVFLPLNADKKANETTSVMDKIEKALEYAKSATETKMLVHCNFLGIPTVDYDSGNPLKEKEIRAEYRKYALNNADTFIKSYGDSTLETKYYIDKALMDGVINNKLNPNKAVWGNSNTPICDISGLKSNEAIAERLFQFSKEEGGDEFVIQLKAIYSAKNK